ncbi:hypothetical protein Q8A67_025067 [Cirrhinus molitorella]|uniref:Uncharacterized protein n=1 Tax=Cirrhinus molitorella TaxID=172907 RepID=A0AA88NX31_9TELE|nr:hypothetical protein Q8A67_025067 [Cirrhinus molitorella]
MDNKLKSEEQIQPWRDSRSQTISGAEGSDSWSLASSAYGSFRSSEADVRSISGSSHSRESSLKSILKSGVRKMFNSMELTPPMMDGDERLDTRSMGSSTYDSLRSLPGADSGSDLSSSCSKLSSHSSGFGSVQPLSESVEHSETKRTQDTHKTLEDTESDTTEK